MKTITHDAGYHYYGCQTVLERMKGTSPSLRKRGTAALQGAVWTCGSRTSLRRSMILDTSWYGLGRWWLIYVVKYLNKCYFLYPIRQWSLRNQVCFRFRNVVVVLRNLKKRPRKSKTPQKWWIDTNWRHFMVTKASICQLGNGKICYTFFPAQNVYIFCARVLLAPIEYG